MSVKALQDYTFVSKYARYDRNQKRRETWTESIERVRDMHLRKYPQISKEIQWAFEQSRQKRALGSQRALQFGGKPIEKKNARIYNCFDESTQFVTSRGVKAFTDFKDGDEIGVLTHKGNWKRATVRSYGESDLFKITITRGGDPYEVLATRDHRWILKDGAISDHLEEDDQLAFGPSMFSEFRYEESDPLERLYWCYGYIYGDGSLYRDQKGTAKWSGARLCGKDASYESRFLEHGFTSSSSASLEGDVMVYTGSYLKSLPNPEKDPPKLIRAFVAGYLAADGTKSRSYKGGSSHGKLSPYESIQATGQESIDFIRNFFPIAGVYIVSEKDITDQETNYGQRSDVTVKFNIISAFGKTAKSFHVDDIQFSHRANVWCLEVEDDQSFMLPFGLPTGNCIASYCDRLRFFQECFWLLLCGCGTGFSVQRHHIEKLPDFSLMWTDLYKFRREDDGRAFPQKVYTVPDTIEGWADALGVLMSSFCGEGDFPEYEGYDVIFDYSLIRKEGSRLSSSSGKAPGPNPLMNALEKARTLIHKCLTMGQKRLRPIDAYDIVMHVSDAVLSGGVRRSATICLFSPDDMEMAKSKTGNWQFENPQRGRSNNSALLIRGKTTKEEFSMLMSFVREFGEPGFVWSDSTELMVNPCVEIGMYCYCKITGLSGWQACNLCEINGKKCKTEQDFAIAAKAAAIIGTCQAGYTDLSYLGETSKNILEQEALMGVSITGMMDNPDVLFNPKLQRKMARLILKVNEEIAEKIGINKCARATCVKPAGTTSCILGTASGIHAHHASRYIRRSQANHLEQPLQHFKRENPLAVEPSVWSANKTDEVISFCIEVPKGAKTKNDIDALHLLQYVKLTQKNWVTAGKRPDLCSKDWLSHNVSNTITVKENEWDSVTDYIYTNRQYFAGISLLPITGDKDYPQAPFTAIYTPRELVQMYGNCSVMASGLIVDGLHAFENNLWKACDAVLGLGEPIEEPEHPNGSDVISLERTRKHESDLKVYEQKIDWVRRARQFAERYLDGNIRLMTYALKDVNNWKYWCDLQREYKDVDYTTMIEEEDNTKLEQTVACSGGACEIV